MSSKDLIVILGPTATGKTSLSVKLAKTFNGEIISADSRQVYKKMNIGTGKDYSEYFIDGTRIPYHLIDVVEPEEEYNLFSFIKEYKIASAEIKAKGKIPFLVGGTGLYIDAVLRGYDLKEAQIEQDLRKQLESMTVRDLQEKLISLNPELHNSTDLIEKTRLIRAIEIAMKSGLRTRTIIPDAIVIGINPGKDVIKARISKRLKERLSAGMIDEIKNLLHSGITFEKLNFFGLEYKFVGMYIAGKLNYNDMFQKLNSAISEFAKRQMTWFRKMEKNGIKINWVENSDYEKAKRIILENIKEI